MFIENKYYRWYLLLVSNPDASEYTEKHHIIPKCMGGLDLPENIVRLSFRKHFIAHWLLTKCVEKQYRQKIFNALSRMGHTNRGLRIVSSWQYEKAKMACSDAHKGKQYVLGMKHSDEAKRKIGEASKGNTYGKGNVHTEETKRKIAEASSKRIRTDAESEKRRKSVSESWKKRKYYRYSDNLQDK